jgi:flavin reductase (DIM6/NTAB) family NADH-FMN oxidoreductase RutF
MAKITLEGKTFYPGYPVYITMLKDADGEILCPTHSSSFSVGNRLILGMAVENETSTFSQVKVGTRLSVNYLSAEQGILFDVCGFSRRGRLSDLADAGGVISEIDDVPTLENVPLTVIGAVEKIENFRGLYTMFIHVETRLIDERLVNSDESVKWLDYSTLEYYGAQKERLYGPSNPSMMAKGQYLKEARRKARKR